MTKLNCTLFCPSLPYTHKKWASILTHTHTQTKHSLCISSFMLECKCTGHYYYNNCISKVKHTDPSHGYQKEVWPVLQFALILLHKAVRWMTKWKWGYLNKKFKNRSHNLAAVVVWIWNGHFQKEGATLLELPGVATNMRALYQQTALLAVCSCCILQELFTCWWNIHTCSTQSTWTHGTKNHSCLPWSCSRL